MSDEGHDHDHSVPHRHYLSVGIDVGSSTSHLIFSRLAVGKRSPMPFARFEVLGREILYASPIMLTPYESPSAIDTRKLDEFLKASYREAVVRPEEVDTGAVITTGEAARKENAERIVQLFASEAGRFVCATAGPYLEAVLAAHGSGTVERSREERSTLLNVDIGGGTTKLTLVRAGEIVETAVINIGARLVAWDRYGRIERLEEAGRIAGREAGVDLGVGLPLTGEIKIRLARALAASVVDMITGEKGSGLTEKLLMTPMLAYRGVVNGLVFSGGVSEYVYGYETEEFGDLGLLLGGEIRSRIEGSRGVWRIPLVAGKERIRATVIGSCQFTLQLSGDTIHVTDPEMLPIRSIPVVPVNLNRDMTQSSVSDAILKALGSHDILHAESRFALALRLPPFFGYGVVEPLAGGIAQALDGPGPPVAVVFEQNIAGVVGEKLSMMARRGFVCIDEIVVHELDYIDVGKQEEGQLFVPVVVKSLVFHTPRCNDGGGTL